MNTNLSLEKCLAFVNCQLQPPRRGSGGNGHKRKLAVTLSRQAGCGAGAIAEKLAQRLQERGAGNGAPWTVFDRNLVEQVLEDHSLPKRLAKFMPEDRISEIEDTIDDLFGLHPPSWMLVRDTAETILRLAELGNVILIGRGANVITRGLEHVFHVRLVAPLENRLESMQQSRHMSKKEALAFIQTEDKGRRRYLKKYFHKNIDDPLLYHLVINTGLMPQDQAASLICGAVLSLQSSHALARLKAA